MQIKPLTKESAVSVHTFLSAESATQSLHKLMKHEQEISSLMAVIDRFSRKIAKLTPHCVVQKPTLVHLTGQPHLWQGQ